MRRNFVFCGDAVPRCPGNGTYLKDVFGKLGSVLDGGSVLDDSADKLISAIVEKFFGTQINDFKLRAKINDLLHNLGKYEHCSKIIYYEKAEGEPLLLLPEDFKNKTLADALKVNSIEFKNIGEKIREKIPKIPFFGHGPAQKEKDGDFDNILEFIPDVHGVLPYASESTSLAPRHFFHKRPLPDFTRSIPSTPRRPHYIVVR